MSSLTASLLSNVYTATFEYPEESCMYRGEISLIPAKTSDVLSPLEKKVRQYAVNLENGHLVLPTLVSLNLLRTRLSLYEKYNIRRLANKFLYKAETMDEVLKLANRIKTMEKMEFKRKNALAAAPMPEIRQTKEESTASSTCSSSGSSSGTSSPQSEPENVFLTGSIDVSATLDRLLKFVKKTE